MADPATSPRTRTYTILGLIGVGGFGRVYRARLTDGDFSKDVAIKMLKDADPSPELLARFRDEARILALLRDRAVVSVEPPIKLADHWAVVMDFVDGLSLGQILNQIDVLPPAVALEVVAEVARAVDKAYHFPGPDGKPLKLLHRDIKPANIQLTPSGEVRLLDFGTARADFANREATTIQDISGTPGYLAPERLEGTEAPAGDVYSLGVTLWAMLTKEGPSKRKSTDLEEGVMAHSAGAPDLEMALRLAIRMRDRTAENRPSLEEVQTIASRAARAMEGEHLDEWCKRVPHRAMTDDDLTGHSLTETIQQIQTTEQGMSRVVMGTAGIGAGLLVAMLAGLLGAVLVLGGLIWVSQQGATTITVVEPPIVKPGVAPVAPVAPVHPSKVSFRSDPPGATVEFDGSPMGKTPIKDRGIELGDHEVVLSKGVFKTKGTFTAEEGKSHSFLWEPMKGANSVTPPFSGGAPTLMSFQSEPLGATVIVDGTPIGETPLEHGLPDGRHVLKLKKGIFEASTTIEVGEDQPSSYTWTALKGDDGFEPEGM